ncbi:hypothetical protein BHM03_00012075 [Ensete ventricosum]|nr:hypothetical protein BHM03_00012075 [Ensete ventricosum]
MHPFPYLNIDWRPRRALSLGQRCMFPGVGVDPSRNFPWPGPTLGVETIGGGVTAVGSDHAMAPIGSSTLGRPPNTGRPAEGFGALGSGSENSGRRFPDDPMRWTQKVFGG